MTKASLQATSIVFGLMFAFAFIVVAMHWHHGEFEPDAKSDFLAVDGLD
jgi:hypothetical protein